MERLNELEQDVEALFPEDEWDEELEAEMLDYVSSGADHKELTESDEFGASLTETIDKSLASKNYNAEYRGWYGSQNRPRWCPQQSKFGGRNGNHKGADIFVPSGTQLVALVNGVIQWNPRGAGGKWGNHIFLNFRNRGNNYTFVYAHLGSLVGSNNRKVSGGDVICKSGCSGNTVYCGKKNKCGGLEDHLHLELFGPGGRIDPIAALRWNMRHANDKRCFFPSC